MTGSLKFAECAAQSWSSILFQERMSANLAYAPVTSVNKGNKDQVVSYFRACLSGGAYACHLWSLEVRHFSLSSRYQSEISSRPHFLQNHFLLHYI